MKVLFEDIEKLETNDLDEIKKILVHASKTTDAIVKPLKK